MGTVAAAAVDLWGNSVVRLADAPDSFELFPRRKSCGIF